MKKRLVCLLTASFSFFSINIHAGVTTKAIQEIIEVVEKTAQKKLTAKISSEFAQDIEKIVSKYGSQSIPFIKSFGKEGIKILENIDEFAGKKIIKLFEKIGNDTYYIINDATKLKLFLKYGDDAAEILLKFPGIADDIIQEFGAKGLKALQNITNREDAAKLALILSETNAKKWTDEIFEIIEKFGQKGLDFIWKNKGKLFLAGVGYSFFNNPEPYINGMTTLVGDKVIEPIIKVIDWNNIVLNILYVLTGYFIFKNLLSMFKKRKNKELN